MDLLVIGEIVKTRGLRGCLKVLTQMEAEIIVAGEAAIYLEDKQGQKKSYRLLKKETAGKFLFLEMEGITDTNAAKALIGYKVLVSREMLGELPAGEYYWRDIIGLDVYTENGGYLGRIESIFPTGSNDVYVCKGQKEILLPAIADVIRQIDLKKRIIIIRLPEGL